MTKPFNNLPVSFSLENPEILLNVSKFLERFSFQEITSFSSLSSYLRRIFLVTLFVENPPRSQEVWTEFSLESKTYFARLDHYRVMGEALSDKYDQTKFSNNRKPLDLFLEDRAVFSGYFLLTSSKSDSPVLGCDEEFLFASTDLLLDFSPKDKFLFSGKIILSLLETPEEEFLREIRKSSPYSSVPVKDKLQIH